jgi:proteic killer suppression protein
VIRNFKDKETQKIFERQRSRKLPSDIQQVALRKLRMLNRSQTLQELRIPPANRLERLSGNIVFGLMTNGGSVLTGKMVMR